MTPRRPAVPIALACLTGACLGPLAPAPASAVAVCVGLIAAARRRASRRARVAGILVAAAAVTAAAAAQAAATASPPESPAPVLLRAEVEREVARGPGPRRAWLVTSGGERGWLEAPAGAEAGVWPGVEVLARGRLAAPRARTGGGDPWRRFARAGARWRFVAAEVRVTRPGFSWAAVEHACRRTLRRLIAAGAAPEEATVLRAVLLGERGPLTPRVRRWLDATGGAHLLSVSGLHVGLWVALAAAALRAAGAGAAARRVGLLVALALCLVLVGARAPTVRAATAAAVAVVFPGRGDVWNRLAVALTVVLALDPTAPRALGVVLSFGSVAAIVAAVSAWRRVVGGLRGRARRWAAAGTVALPAAASAALLGVTLGTVPAVGVLLGPPTIALLGVALACGAAAFAVGPLAPALGAGLIHGAAGAVSLLLELLRWGAELAPATAVTPPAPVTAWTAVGLLALGASRLERGACGGRSLAAVGGLLAGALVLPGAAPARPQPRALATARTLAVSGGPGRPAVLLGAPGRARPLREALHRLGAPRAWPWDVAGGSLAPGVRALVLPPHLALTTVDGRRTLVVRDGLAARRVWAALPAALRSVDRVVLGAGVSVAGARFWRAASGADAVEVAPAAAPVELQPGRRAAGG